MNADAAKMLRDALAQVPHGCCGKRGPNLMYGPSAELMPVCHCGELSAYQDGTCMTCGAKLGRAPPEGEFVEADPPRGRES